jgi:hypothetical protein
MHASGKPTNIQTPRKKLQRRKIPKYLNNR